jgi:hypothetical protein
MLHDKIGLRYAKEEQVPKICTDEPKRENNTYEPPKRRNTRYRKKEGKKNLREEAHLSKCAFANDLDRPEIP